MRGRIQENGSELCAKNKDITDLSQVNITHKYKIDSNFPTINYTILFQENSFHFKKLKHVNVLGKDRRT